MKPISTIPSGERTWFVRRDGTWAMLHPHPDGSASVRTEAAFRTFHPPDGIKDAVASLEADDFMLLDDARALGIVSPSKIPPKW